VGAQVRSVLVNGGVNLANGFVFPAGFDRLRFHWSGQEGDALALADELTIAVYSAGSVQPFRVFSEAPWEDRGDIPLVRYTPLAVADSTETTLLHSGNVGGASVPFPQVPATFSPGRRTARWRLDGYLVHQTTSPFNVQMYGLTHPDQPGGFSQGHALFTEPSREYIMPSGTVVNVWHPYNVVGITAAYGKELGYLLPIGGVALTIYQATGGPINVYGYLALRPA